MNKNMDILNEIIKTSELFDYYGILLKDKQSEIVKAYVIEDLSLSEIADLNGISRQGVYDSLKRSTGQLKEFDSKLGLIEKSDKLDKIIISLEEIAKSSNSDCLKKEIYKNIERLKNIF